MDNAYSSKSTSETSENVFVLVFFFHCLFPLEYIYRERESYSKEDQKFIKKKYVTEKRFKILTNEKHFSKTINQ